MATREMVTVPTIHLNGSGGDRLLRALGLACDALRAAEDAVVETEPHGRDYYVQQGGRFEAAQRQHRERLEKIETVRRELEYMALSIANQMDARRAR